MKKIIAVSVVIVLAGILVIIGYFKEKANNQAQPQSQVTQQQTDTGALFTWDIPISWALMTWNMDWNNTGNDIDTATGSDIVSGTIQWNTTTTTTTTTDPYADDAMKDPDVQEVLKLFEELTK